MSDDTKLYEYEKHKNRRDEQFWFTIALLSFNGVLLSRPDAQHAVFGLPLPQWRRSSSFTWS